MQQIRIKINSALISIFTCIIRMYQIVISPVIGPRCRYLPSCSQYTLEALKLHGITRGGYMALLRILRCNPWGSSGLDPVPDKKIK